MSIELKQAAQRALNALDEATTYTSSPSWSPSMTDECIAAASALRTALAQQPATGEPVAWLDEMLADTREVFDAGGSETPQVVRDVIEYVKSWVTVYSEKNHQAPAAQPAPSEPATGEPVAYVDRDGFIIETGLLLTPGTKLYTHPAPSVPADVVRVPLQVLKDASEALGNFVSDHGWGDADMQAMDNLDAYIARHAANRAAVLTAKDASA